MGRRGVELGRVLKPVVLVAAGRAVERAVPRPCRQQDTLAVLGGGVRAFGQAVKDMRLVEDRRAAIGQEPWPAASTSATARIAASSTFSSLAARAKSSSVRVVALTGANPYIES